MCVTKENHPLMLLALSMMLLPISLAHSLQKAENSHHRTLQFSSNNAIIINGRVMDLQTDCYDLLQASDVQPPFGKIDSEEYVIFANLTSGDGFLNDLPLLFFLAPLNLAFNHLSCLCKFLPHNSSDCCLGANAGINITGANGENDIHDDQIAYLYTVCDLTYDSVEDFRGLTPEPSPSPTESPTVSPSFLPSIHPSSGPSLFPPDQPSSYPSMTPFLQSSPTPTAVPTDSLSPLHSPSQAPIITPTLFTGEILGSYQFTIGNEDFNAEQINAESGDIKTEVEEGSLVLARDVLSAAFPSSGRRIFRERARGLSAFISPTSNVSCVFIDVECPPVAGIQASTLCQNCECELPLFLEEETASAVQLRFQGGMESAIVEGRLSVTSATYIGPARDIALVQPPSGPRVTPTGDGDMTTPSSIASDDNSEPGNKSTGIIGGAVGAAALGALVLIAGGYFLRRKYNNTKSESDSDGEYSVSDGKSGSEVKRSPSSRSNRGAVLGASNPNYGLNRRIAFATHDDSSSVSSLEAGIRNFKRVRSPTSAAAAASNHRSRMPYDLPDDSNSSSSNAGSSGWSSSAGISSVNTSLEDSLEFRTPHQLRVSTLASMGKASAITQKISSKEANSQRQSLGMRDVDISTLESDTGSGVLSGDFKDSTGPVDLNGMDSVPTLPAVSRADLDYAIEAGDWAAVGATAALLASTAEVDSRSFHSTSTRSNRSKSSVSPIDIAHIAALDELVDAGDWKGVVQVAAQFESESDAGSRYDGDTSHTTSVSSDGTGGLGSKSAATTGSRSAGTSVNSPSVESDTPSKILKRAEIRSEVEHLARRVVPDEMDNIDEMMLQFRGREEELLETLRTMQERSIAQRAREATQKSVKREARSMARARSQQQVSVVVSSTTDAVRAMSETWSRTSALATSRLRQQPTSIPDESGMHESIEPPEQKASTREPSQESGYVNDEQNESLPQVVRASHNNKRPGLELAFRTGEAARVMSDTSVTTDSTNFYDAERDPLTSVQRTDANADRVAELDRMIINGDWSGVVAAASRYSAADARTGAKSLKGSSGGSKGSESSGSRAGAGLRRSRARATESTEDRTYGSGSVGSSWMNRMFGTKRQNEDTKRSALQEEQDALDNAAMWMAIAEQSKKEESAEFTKGASEAADWAISRSLSALKSAEQSGNIPRARTQQKGSSSLSISGSVTSSRGDKSV